MIHARTSEVGRVPRFVELRRGKLALDHRPRLRDVPRLRDAGCTHVMTLLSEREGARTIGDAVRSAGMDWLWLPLENGDPPAPERDAEVREVFRRLARVLDDGSSVLIHCSAGIHRTGMIAHALMRNLGLSREAAMDRLRATRHITSEGVGDARVAWGERFASEGRDEIATREDAG